ncbi:hypothetical protein D5S17_27340 [Pseudonocardiaceae bacterium YIM PH 21723]|nr:hypothetical protein D5S17_27340 [Pseudonocardiaceae bacterium YIM PH 21723]
MAAVKALTVKGMAWCPASLGDFDTHLAIVKAVDGWDMATEVRCAKEPYKPLVVLEGIPMDEQQICPGCNL